MTLLGDMRDLYAVPWSGYGMIWYSRV